MTLRWDNGQGLVFVRKIEIDDNYLFTVTQSVENKGDKALTLFPYALVSRHGTPKTDGLYILHEGPLGVFRDKAGDNGTLRELGYGDLADDKVRALIHSRAAESQLFVAAEQGGLRTMREDGERLVRAGVTSLEEVLRVTRD